MGKGPKKIHEIVTHYLTHSGSRADVAEKLKKRTGSGSTTALSAWSRNGRIPKSRDQIMALRKIVECQCPEYTDEAIKAAMPKTPHPVPKPREARSVGKADREALEAVSRLSAAVIAEYDVVTRRANGVRLSRGVYVTRSIERRLLRRLTVPSVNAIVGEAGYGKTALMWQMHRILSGEGYAPILIPASALVTSQHGGTSDDGSRLVTVDLIARALHEAQRADTVPVLLIDTLDLLLNDPSCKRLVEKLLSMAFQENVRAVVTSRPVEISTMEINYDPKNDPEATRTLQGLTLGGYDQTERPQAITAYARAFYPREMVADARRIVDRASLRGLPILEITRNPLSLRLLFEVNAPNRLPAEDVDTIKLYDQFWSQRVESDSSPGRDAHPHGTSGLNLTRETEAIGLGLLSDGRIIVERNRLIELQRLVLATSHQESETATDILRNRFVLTGDNDTQFFHQTFFEHAAARGVATRGRATIELLAQRVDDDPTDLFFGEVAAQVVLLAGRHSKVPVPLADEILARWLADERSLVQTLALRTYARKSNPSAALHRQAKQTLQRADFDAVKGYLHLVPSVARASLDQVVAEFDTVWRRVVPDENDRPAAGSEVDAGSATAADSVDRSGHELATRVIETLTRLAATHPEAVLRFVNTRGCLAWLSKRDVEVWRHHDSQYIRLLQALAVVDPRWCVERAMEFWEGFRGTPKRGQPKGAQVSGMAEILQLLNELSERCILLPEVTDQIASDVRTIQVTKNAADLEHEYAVLRGEALATARPDELVKLTKAVLGRKGWSKTGRRAELRAVARAAFAFNEAEARDFLDAVSDEVRPERMEDLCVVYGDTLLGNEPPLDEDGEKPSAEAAEHSSTTLLLRQRARETISALSAADSQGTSPLIVRALHGAKVAGKALLAALPENAPQQLWLRSSCLRPLLVRAAVAGHPDAVAALDAWSASISSQDPSETEVLIDQLQYAATAGSEKALDTLITLAYAGSAADDLRSALENPKTPVHMLRDQRKRLSDLRRSLTTSSDASAAQQGYLLWKQLIIRDLDESPSPSQLARLLTDRPNSVYAHAILELAVRLIGSPHWRGCDLLPLEGVCSFYAHEGQVARTENAPPGSGRVSQRSRAIITREGPARQILIAIASDRIRDSKSRQRRARICEQATTLVWEAGYQPDDQEGCRILASLTGELAMLGERLATVDPPAGIKLILGTANRLNLSQPKPTTWRDGVSRAWRRAIEVAVVKSASAESRHLVDQLLRTDSGMARWALTACVDHLRPVPDWLKNIAGEIPSDVRERYQAALKRQAREGSRRTMPELLPSQITST